MSLQLVAQHLAEKGRGPDSTLVHMSNKEVAGLQALAQKHGGQLSVNPSTGLPEAGFLDNILPMVAGAGLTYFSGGAINPLMAGGIIGGITALDSKDLSKGLVAGLGAYGGSGMVGGLAGLGAQGALAEGASYGAGVTGETAREAATQQAIANGTYQSAVGAGASNFANAPMSSLSALGNGSAIKGSLPILAGLAPAAVEAFDEGDEGDGAPAQHKGYIRKYAFDPATGQYKQVGVYEAGGDPNVDVSSKAGTAGAYGGVRQSEYEAAQGMADGGSTSDSSRIYDYLMGRGPNPMQFTHTTAPQVDYNINKPITPTTPILEPVYDPYGNRSEGGRGQSGDEGPPGEGFNPTSEGAYNVSRFGQAISNISPIAGALVGAYGNYMARNVNPNYSNEGRNAAPSSPLGNSPISAGFDYSGLDGVTNSLGNSQIGEGFNYNGLDDGSNWSSTADAKGDATGGYGSAEAARDAAGRDPGGWNDSGNNDTGSNDNDNGGQFARGGISGHLRPPQPFYANGKFSYKGPQVYADGGIAALAQRYDDGGMTLPLKAQPINNLGSMHPKSLQAAYDHAVATNDVAGARKYQNELGLRSKLQNVQMYADGGEAEHYNLGGYSDGGRLLKGPGDGVSDDIPATIGHGQPARLADGEFVIPARIVSEIGNGSTDAGARELYKMMDRIQAGRAKTVGKDQVARNSKAVRHLPA